MGINRSLVISLLLFMDEKKDDAPDDVYDLQVLRQFFYDADAQLSAQLARDPAYQFAVRVASMQNRSLDDLVDLRRLKK